MQPRFIFFISSLFLLALCVPGYAQDDDAKALAMQYMEQAKLIMEASQAMGDARDLYIQAAESDPSNIEANLMAGDLLLMTTGKDRAVKYYTRILEADPEYRFDIIYQIGRSYQYGYEFDKAIENYNQYKTKLKGNSKYDGKDKVSMEDVERRIYECNNGKEYVANPSPYAIVNLGSAINSEYEDYAPVLNEDETMMIFTSRRRDDNLNQNVYSDNKSYEDIFISERENEAWTYAKNLGTPVNTEFHDSNIALSANGKQLFIYKDNGNGDIYISNKKDNGKWSTPEVLGKNINTAEYQETSVSLSYDGKTLFFASDRPGGQGGSDIYYSKKTSKGDWGEAVNLGKKINSQYDEDAPFISYEGNILYFSSRGRKGMGGYDIFKSVYDSAAGKWGEPENLGYPINTPDNDIYYVNTKDGERGYYASTREDGQGLSDIYMIERKEEAPPAKDSVVMQSVIITVEVYADGKKLTDATVSMKAVEDNMVAGKTSNGTGIYVFTVNNVKEKLYNLSVEKDGYVFQTIKVSVPAAAAESIPLSQTVTLQKLKVGTRSVLRNIYFDFGKATFKEASYTELNKLEKMMAQNSGMTIEISGHTDNIGKKSYNKILSQKRADAVKSFLMKKGIAAGRVTAIGYGEEKPMASNDDEKEGRALNRRVEFKVLSKR